MMRKRKIPAAEDKEEEEAMAGKRPRRSIAVRDGKVAVGGPEGKRVKRREYYIRNRDKVAEKQADYYQKNRGEVIRKQHEYYHRHKDRITKAKRQSYKDGPAISAMAPENCDVGSKQKPAVHPSLVESIRLDEAARRATGTLRISSVDAIVDKFNAEVAKKWKVVYDVQAASDFVPDCGVEAKENQKQPGASKLAADPSEKQMDTKPLKKGPAELRCLPNSYSYRSKPLTSPEIGSVIGFAAVSLSAITLDKVGSPEIADGTSLDPAPLSDFLEVRPLLHKDHITLEALRDLFHTVMSVLDVDMHDLLTERHSLFFINPTCLSNPVLRNRYSKQIIKAGLNPPEPPKPLCKPCATFETAFVAFEEASEDIPHHQLLINKNLKPCDTAALAAIVVSDGDDDDNRGHQGRGHHHHYRKAQLAPIFAINMTSHWKYFLKMFDSTLVGWFGDHALLSAVLHELPCVITAKNRHIQEMRQDCYRVLQLPKEVAICEHCGQKFEFNRYLTGENKKYQSHVESHKRQCKFCGLSFGSGAARLYHERTHRKGYFRCDVASCTYVGRSAKAVETHAKFKHKREMCDQCGKEFQNVQGLNLHREVYHMPKGPNQFECEICSRAYRTKNERDKHVARHNKDNCLIDRWMHEDPKLYKYECTRHSNCKRYFKEAYSLRKHLRRMGDKEYPSNLSRFFRPDIPPDQLTIKDYELPPEPDIPRAATAAAKPKPKAASKVKGDHLNTVSDDGGSSPEAAVALPAIFLPVTASITESQLN